MNKTYTVKDLSERYIVGVQTVLGWIRNGDLQAINVGRRLGKKKPRWRITEEALKNFELLRSAQTVPLRKPRRRKDPNVIEFYK